MTGNSILSRFQVLCRQFGPGSHRAENRLLDLHTAWQHPEQLPKAGFENPVVGRILDLLGPLDWAHFPERDLGRRWCQPAVPYAAFAAAMLVKLNEGLNSMADLRRYLAEHPGLIPLLGFSVTHFGGSQPQGGLPTQRHLTRMLREIPNTALQFLLDDSAHLICDELQKVGIRAGDCVSLDTKHILAWVKENNPKAYVENRFDKKQQPRGDPDCKLGCKRKHNRQVASPDRPATPSTNPLPANLVAVGEYHWGYGSGVVAVKVPDFGEFILAELTQPFNQPDLSYFLPLMRKTEQVLGFKPRWGTFDAAFDAWYVYDYFHRPDDPDAFAAVPFSEKGGYKAGGRSFSPEGLPICQAGLPMPLLFTFTDRTTSLVEHERGKYGCPLSPASDCPIHHKNAAEKGCTAMMPTSPGARLRYTLDRSSETYKAIYRQRTAVERINSQAVALGIECPHLRNGDAIANVNTLIYTLINLRVLQRIRQKLANSAQP